MQQSISFRAFVLSLRDLRYSAALSFLGNVSGKDVSIYVQSLTFRSLQRISNAIRAPTGWVFFISLDGVTVVSSSYIGLRIRFHRVVKMCNFHLMAIPINGSYTGEAIYRLRTLLDSFICQSGN